jgi:hypothetical protein
MPGLVWTSLFLLLTLIGSAVGCASMIGMPILAEVQAGVYASGLLLAGFGCLLLARTPSVAPQSAPLTLSRPFDH